MSYKALKLCKDEGDYFEVDPAVMFPATIQRIKEALKNADPVELMSPGWEGRPDREPVADKFLRTVEAFPSGALDFSLTPFSYFENMGLEKLDDSAKKQRVSRAEVLDFAESWFRRALSLEVGRGLRIHISKNLDYRR